MTLRGLGGDQRAASEYQYSTTNRLAARIAIHRYGTNPEPWYAWVLRHLPAHAGQHILEVGAGTGELWRGANLSGITLTLTDASPAMCDALRGFPNVLRCRADAIPVADGTVDGVVANHMLYHLNDPRKAISEVRRVLRPGGWIAAATNGDNHLAQLRDLARHVGVPAAAPDMPLSYSRENGPALLAEHFDDIQEIPYPDELRVPSAAPILDYLASCADRPLTNVEIAALRDAAENAVQAHGVFRVTKDTVLFIAR